MGEIKTCSSIEKLRFTHSTIISLRKCDGAITGNVGMADF